MNYLEKLIGDIETHSVEGIRECFKNGISPNDFYNNEPLINELTSEYGRTPLFKECVQAFVDHGLVYAEKTVLAVLLDDAVELSRLLEQDPSVVHKKYSLRCAYTPLEEVTLLHICAEFNHITCARVLVERGADINAAAGTDHFGFGGQTPLFHTVNQNTHNSSDMFHYLLSLKAEVMVTVRGLIWGKSYPWETFIPAVNPVSYAMMGLLPQMHRNEQTIATVVSALLKAAYGLDYTPPNIPNKYVNS